MKHTVYRYFSILFSMLIFIISFFSLCSTSYAITPEEFMEGAHSWDEMDTTQKWITIGLFIVAECKAVVTADFVGFLDNDAKFSEYRNAHSPDDFVSDDGEDGRELAIPKELVTIIKQCLDDYAAENQPFKLEKTYKASLIPASRFCSKVEYEHFLSYFDSDSYNYVVFRIGSSGYNFLQDITPVIKDGGGFVHYRTTNVFNMYRVYDSDWKHYTTPLDLYIVKKDENGDSYIEYSETKGGLDGIQYFVNHSVSFYDRTSLATPDGGTIRVYNTVADYINYSVGQRKIYYTSEYYNYVPKDLQVSIDDLQKTIDDMQDVIDKLLDQITNNTSESEIEELLRQILEELKNNQGGSSGGDGGGGSGGGDVNVDIDLSGTNSLLSKILAKVTQISEKISTSAGQSMTDVVNSIKELGEMLQKYLKTITGDLDEIKNHLDEMTEEQFSEKADSFLNETAGSFSEIGEVAKGKFPFSIPNDMRTLLELLSIPPPSPETAALYDAGSPAIQPLSSDHGGGGTTRPPTGGIASVEQGNSGGSFGISESGAPVIRCPIVIKRLGIDYAIKIDLSEFDKVAALARTFLTFLFIYGLYNLTFKVIGLWGDLTE